MKELTLLNEIQNNIRYLYRAYSGEEDVRSIIYQSMVANIEQNYTGEDRENLIIFLNAALDKYFERLKSFSDSYEKQGEQGEPGEPGEDR